MNITSYQWKTLTASFLGYCLDAFDWMLLSFVIPLIMITWGTPASTAGLIATVTTFGAVLGGWIIGILGEYFGRVRMLTITILLYSIFTGLCAIATSVDQLMVFRFLTGLGLGAEWGLAQTLIAETWPPDYRGRAASFVHSGWPVGYGIAAAAFALLAPHFGWQGLFLIGVIPAVVVFWIRRHVPESPAFVQLKSERIAMKERQKQGKAMGEETVKSTFPLVYIFSKQHIRITLPLLIFILGSYVTYWGVMTWVPTMLYTEHHLSIAKTGAFVIALNIAGFIGANVFGWISDRIGRKATYAPYLIISAIVLYFYGHATSNTATLILGILFGFLIFGLNAGQGAFYSEMFPTHVRSTALNFLTNIGRLVSAFTPYYIGYLMPKMGLGAVLSLFSILFIVMLFMLFFLPERKGKDIISSQESLNY
ncbi:MAG: MFS transporter [Desulfitobacteriaceae bacterium]